MSLTSNGIVTSLSTEFFTANRFWVEIDNILEAVFVECSGLQATTEVLTVKEGGLNSHVHHLPTRTTFSNLTLKRGMSSSLKFWNWYQSTVNGKVETQDMSIILYSPGDAGIPVRSWLVSGAYPVKWSAPTFNAKTQEFAVESVELTYDWFKITM